MNNIPKHIDKNTPPEMLTKYNRHDELCQEIHQTYLDKNHDYGDSFGQTFRALGLISAVTRISDKYNRLVSLATAPQDQRVKDEKIEDTLLDMANYCVMTVVELELQRMKENEQG